MVLYIVPTIRFNLCTCLLMKGICFVILLVEEIKSVRCCWNMLNKVWSRRFSSFLCAFLRRKCEKLMNMLTWTKKVLSHLLISEFCPTNFWLRSRNGHLGVFRGLSGLLLDSSRSFSTQTDDLDLI